MSKTQGSSTTQISDSVSDTPFVEVLTFDIDVSGDSPSTGNHNVSVDVNAIDPGSTGRFRIQAIDDSGCGVSASSSYSSTFTTNGIKTLSATSLTWGAGDERLRLSIELSRDSGQHGNKDITINVQDADTFVEAPWDAATTYFQDVGDYTEAPTGALTRKTSKVAMGQYDQNPLGTLARKTHKVALGQYDEGPVGTLSATKVAPQDVGDYVLGPTGTLVRTTKKSVGGYTEGPLGALTRKTLIGVGGYTEGPIGTLGAVKVGVLTPQDVGDYVLGPTGALTTAKITAQAVGGYVLGPTGVLIKKTLKSVGGYTEGPLGALATQFKYGQDVGGFTLGPTATVSLMFPPAGPPTPEDGAYPTVREHKARVRRIGT
jgi:hypothetical protein